MNTGATVWRLPPVVNDDDPRAAEMPTVEPLFELAGHESAVRRHVARYAACHAAWRSTGRPVIGRSISPSRRSAHHADRQLRTSISWHPTDGTRLLSVSEDALHLWNADAGLAAVKVRARPPLLPVPAGRRGPWRAAVRDVRASLRAHGLACGAAGGEGHGRGRAESGQVQLRPVEPAPPGHARGDGQRSQRPRMGPAHATVRLAATVAAQIGGVSSPHPGARAPVPLHARNRPTYAIERAHAVYVRDMCFNPNRQYTLATAGDDGRVRWAHAGRGTGRVRRRRGALSCVGARIGRSSSGTCAAARSR